MPMLMGCWRDDAPDNTASALQLNPQIQTVAHMNVVGPDGEPLSNMIPLASDEVSLFAEPIAQGSPTGDTGESDLAYPKDRWVFIRAADPEGNYFAENYQEVQPKNDGLDEIEIRMQSAAAVTATAQSADGQPIVNAPVELLMMHPAHGPWWRAETESDESGLIRFDGIPPGVFVVKVRIGTAAELTFREVMLTPGEDKDLGPISPQAETATTGTPPPGAIDTT